MLLNITRTLSVKMLLNLRLKKPGINLTRWALIGLRTTGPSSNNLNLNYDLPPPTNKFFFKSKCFLIGLRNYDCDGNGNVKKAVSVMSKKNLNYVIIVWCLRIREVRVRGPESTLICDFLSQLNGNTLNNRSNEVSKCLKNGSDRLSKGQLTASPLL